MNMLTEDQIERRVERVMDTLDYRLLNGELSQSDYDREVSILDKWAQQQYDELTPNQPRHCWPSPYAQDY